SGGALILRRRPDVALVDLALPGMSGAELTRSLLKEDPDPRLTPLLAKGGHGWAKRLSPREREIMALLSQGSPARRSRVSSSSPRRRSARTCGTPWGSSARRPAPTPSRWPSSTA